MKKTIVLACSLFIGSMNLYADCLLRGVQYLETGSQKSDIAVADFNRDGFQDVAIAGAEAGVVRVFLNQGDGDFVLSNEKRVNSSAALIEAADFNGDSVADLAVGGTGSVGILVNDGAGKFTIARERINTRAIAIAAGDFNSDSIADVAILARNGQEGTVAIFLNANGVFTRTQTFAVKSPSDLIAARLGSGRTLDLVAASEQGAVIVYKGSATGTFRETSSVKAIPGAARLAAGLINADEMLDLVVAGTDGAVAVLLGQNDNEFRRLQMATGTEIQGVALADFNQDHRADLFLVNRNSRGSLYTGKGDGSFAFARGFAFGLFTGPIVAADFNHDSKSDFIAAEAGAAGVFLGNGKNNFVVGARTVLNQGGNLFAGDFNADGNDDLLISGSNGSILLRGKGDGSFLPPLRTVLPQIGYATVTDLNGDGRADLAGFDKLRLKAWLTMDGVEFVETASMPLGIDPPVQAVDINGDGLQDLAVMIPGRLMLFQNEGDGKFKTLPPLGFGNQHRGTLIDLNGDGIPDLATVQDSKVKLLSIYIGGPKLSFTKLAEVPLEGCPGGIASGDANGDGKNDLVIGSSCDSRLTLLIGDGSGGFSNILKIVSGSGSYEPGFADFNNDGNAEVLAIARNLGKPSIAIAPGFNDYDILGPFYWNRVATADFDHDGNLDLAASSFNSTAVFLNCR